METKVKINIEIKQGKEKERGQIEERKIVQGFRLQINKTSWLDSWFTEPFGFVHCSVEKIAGRVH